MLAKEMWTRKLYSLYINNKTYTVVLFISLITTILIIHAALSPRVRESNAFQTNNIGPSGEQRFPHAIIIGVRKAGTRAILSYLKRHPDIAIAQAEVHFFSDWRNYRMGLEWYRSLMPYSRKDQLTIEKTPAYFHTPGTPEKIHQMNSTIKLILVVRDPVDRAVSDYLQFYTKYWWFRALHYSFEDVSNEGSVFHGFLDRSNYITILQEWLKYFPKEQILVLDGKKIAQNPIEEMRITEDFLGVRHYLDERLFVYNEEKHFYCIRDTPDSEKPHCLGDSKGRVHPEIDEQVKQNLIEYFTPFNEQLFEFIGRRFDWSTSKKS